MIVNLIKDQTIDEKIYQSHDCKFFDFKRYDCGKSYNSEGNLVEDKTIGWVKCNGGLSVGQKICAKPNINECKIGNSLSGKDPLEKTTWWKNAPFLNCSFNTKNIDNYSQILNLEKKFYPIENNAESMNKIKGNLCMTTTSKNCPIDPETSKPYKKCSRFLSLDKEGEICRDWASSVSVKKSDNKKLELCSKNMTLKECKCINRFYNSDYRKLKKHLPEEDYCWYLPCSSGPYLKEENIELNKHCSNICQIIIEADKNKKVNINDNSNIINCSNFKDQEKQIKNYINNKKKEKSKSDFVKNVIIILFFFYIFIIFLKIV